ncbi:hypothetical protein [Echinimonas agarilytica]|uniref:Uncharacterized protein n=1 Tax=Echinimonas agarilytica TaxID=1215918 RepID=A0AA41W9C5_9GAMM|nr:hypothetical protein [Echinimonas agarilytica]MCM2681530.1 hypothetical protein [Echinimonas agarilytica]
MKQKSIIVIAILTMGLLVGLPSFVRAEQGFDIPNSTPENAIFEFNEWTKRFLGLSKKQALYELRDFNGKEVRYKSKNGNAQIRLEAELPNGYMQLFMHPQKQKIRSVAFTLKEVFTTSSSSLIDVRDVVVRNSANDFNSWSRQFVGHNKSKVLESLRGFNAKEVTLQRATPYGQETIYAKLPLRGIFQLFINPESNLVVASRYHLSGLNHLGKEKR